MSSTREIYLLPGTSAVSPLRKESLRPLPVWRWSVLYIGHLVNDKSDTKKCGLFTKSCAFVDCLAPQSSPQGGGNALNSCLATAIKQNEGKERDAVMENRAKRKPWTTAMPLPNGFGNFVRNTVATAAAEEALGVFQKVVDEDELQRLYQVSWNPKVKLHRLGESLHFGIMFAFLFLCFLLTRLNALETV